MQRLRRLLSRRSARETEDAFVIEGHNLLREAVRAGIAVESVYTTPDASADEAVTAAYEAGARVFTITPEVVARVADTVTPQPVLAVVPRSSRSLDELADADLVLVCVDLRDPGNAGTVLRSAEAAGARGVVCCGGSVDLFNPKTVRASAGAIFHVPIVVGGDPLEVLSAIGSWGVRRLATTARGGRDYTETDLTEPVAFVLGNEAHGLPAGLRAEIDDEVMIPMDGRAESLNVGVAAAVLCFEAARQRRVRHRGAGSWT